MPLLPNLDEAGEGIWFRCVVDFPERRDKLLYSRFGIPGLWLILVCVLMVVLKVIVARFPQKFG